MTNLKQISALAAMALLVGCAGPQPTAYTGLASASYLQPDPNGPAKIPYAYASDVSWQNYSKIIVDPVTIYQGPDNQFGTTGQEGREKLAAYMQKQFTKKLATRFAITDQPGADTLRVHLTLTGATKSTPLLSTALHFDIAGNLYNGVQLVRGGPAIMTGTVLYSVEIYDSQSNKLLEAYVTKQYPNSENIIASFGSLTAAETGIDKGASALLERLQG